jgi:DNA-binding NarL/FixJ family response regulator
MNRILLADNQVIFRAGAARMLSLEEDMLLVSLCANAAQLMDAIAGVRHAIVIFSASLGVDVNTVLERIQQRDSRSILILENGESFPQGLPEDLNGVVPRAVTGPELVECVRRVARGERCVALGPTLDPARHDSVAARVRQQLTPKEFKIVGLIVEGRKNKEIAERLGTKEQVIKNYLRSIYDKTGVSDRLELALFTIHHRILVDAA